MVELNLRDTNSAPLTIGMGKGLDLADGYSIFSCFDRHPASAGDRNALCAEQTPAIKPTKYLNIYKCIDLYHLSIFLLHPRLLNLNRADRSAEPDDAESYECAP